MTIDGAHYRFVSTWLVPAAPAVCWSAMTDLVAGRATWWPGVAVVASSRGMKPGSEVVLRVRSPLGYALRVRAVISRVDAGCELVAQAEGDLAGTGSVTLEAADDVTRIVIVWDVRTRRPWMTLASPMLRPAFRWAHTRVMRAGERGLRAVVVTPFGGPKS